MLVKFAVLFVIFGTAQAHLLIALPPINETHFSDSECIPAPSPEKVGLDLEWFRSNKKFYLPLWTRLYKVRVAKDSLDRENITDAEVWPFHACLEFSGNNVTAFGRTVEYKIDADESGISFQAPRNHSRSGKFEFHLTDNENYVLGVTCWEDFQATWALLTTKPIAIEDKTKARILKYFKDLGFKSENVVEESYSFCPQFQKPIIALFPAFSLTFGWKK